MNANTTWNPGSDFPADGSPKLKLAHAIKCVNLAAQAEEWHPWQFRLADKFVELSAITGGALETADPEGRETMIQCGGALSQLKLALKRHGWLGRVELFPDMADPDLVARIHYGTGPASTAHDAALFKVMAQKRNKSATWSEPPVSPAMLEAIQSHGVGDKAWLEFSQCDASRERLIALAESDAGRPAVAGYQLAAPENSRGTHWTRPLLTFVVGAGDSHKFTVEPGDKRAGEMGVLAVIKTKTDDKHGWLATGEAQSRIKLQARALDLPSQVFNRVFKNRRIREVLRMSIGRKGFVQAIVGFGSQPAHWTGAAPEQPLPGRMFESETDFFSRIRPD